MTSIIFEKVQNDLPDWPADVIRQWLLVYAQGTAGWPPPDPLTPESRWKGLISRPLSWWQGVVWTRVLSPLDKSEICALDRDTQGKMHHAYFGGGYNEYSFISDGRERALSVLLFIREHGTLPAAPIAMKISDGLTFVDGSHRMVAWHIYTELAETNKLSDGAAVRASSQPVWVGEHLSGEYYR